MTLAVPEKSSPDGTGGWGMGHPGKLLDPPPARGGVRAQAPGARRATRCGQQIPLLQVKVQVPCPGGQ